MTSLYTEILIQAEQATSRKEAKYLINLADKVRREMNQPEQRQLAGSLGRTVIAEP